MKRIYFTTETSQSNLACTKFYYVAFKIANNKGAAQFGYNNIRFSGNKDHFVHRLKILQKEHGFTELVFRSSTCVLLNVAYTVHSSQGVNCVLSTILDKQAWTQQLLLSK